MKIAVIAANRKEFNTHVFSLIHELPGVDYNYSVNNQCWTVGADDYIYAYNPEMLRGLRIDKFERVGNWRILPVKVIHGFDDLEKINNSELQLKENA